MEKIQAEHVSIINGNMHTLEKAMANDILEFDTSEIPVSQTLI